MAMKNPLTVTQYAALHGVSRQRVLQYLTEGRFGKLAQKVGSTWIISTRDDVRKTRGQ